MSWFGDWARGTPSKGSTLFTLLITLLPAKTRRDFLSTLVRIRSQIASGKTEAALQALDKLISGLGGDV